MVKCINSLYSPIISVVLQQLVTVEESGVKPAHIPIAGGEDSNVNADNFEGREDYSEIKAIIHSRHAASVNYVVLDHLLASSLGTVLIDPVWLEPVVLGY